MTTDLRYIDAESKTAAQVLTSTTHVLVLTCLVPCSLTCLLTLLTYLLRAYSLAYSRTAVQVTSSAVMKFKCTGKGKKGGSSPSIES